jgi:hypothetical protein
MRTWKILALALSAGCREGGGPSGSTGDAEPGDQTSPWGEPRGAEGGGPPNAAPGPPEISLEPATPTTQDPLEVSIVSEALDPDAGPEPVSYRVAWSRDGVAIPQTGLTLPAALTQRGEVWRAEVRGFDGVNEGAPVSAEVTIRNSPPTVTGVEILPAAADTDSVLACTVGGRVDADGDDVSVTYRWVANEVLIAGEGAAALQPPLVLGAKYRCAVTPFDGQVEGGEVWSPSVVPGPVQGELAGLISIQPKSVDLGVVLPGEVSIRTVTVTNYGDGDLVVSEAAVGGDPGFSELAPIPMVIPPDGSVSFEVSFATEEPGLKKGTLDLTTNAANPAAASLPLIGVGAAPCLVAAPALVDFGGAYLASFKKIPVVLTSCGQVPVTVESWALLAPSGSPLSIDASVAPGELPWKLDPGETATLNAVFHPLQASPVDAQGIPIPETAELSVSTGLGLPLTKVTLRGFASEVSCPVPIVEILEGLEVPPDTLLHISGQQSFTPSGKPAIYAWGVAPPSGVAPAPIQPSNDLPEITYQTSGLGTYTVQLKVFDEVDGKIVPGCVDGVAKVIVTDATPIILELTWDTPGDSDQDDAGPGLGGDLDLHLHNGLGDGEDYDGDGKPDSWFDPAVDVYWLDTSPEWGLLGDPDDPTLTLQDPDGKGPERIVWERPVPGTYTVGVHVYAAFEYGSSLASVRVWFFEKLAAEYPGMVLQNADLWEVVSIAWPKRVLTQAFKPDGGPKLLSAYPTPFFD